MYLTAYEAILHSGKGITFVFENEAFDGVICSAAGITVLGVTREWFETDVSISFESTRIN